MLSTSDSAVSHMVVPAEIDEFEENVSLRLFTEVKRAACSIDFSLFRVRLFGCHLGKSVSQLLDMLVELLAPLNEFGA